METDRFVVLKFGGSSLATADRLKRIIEIIRDARSKNQVACVVSAMGDTTDHLVEALAIAKRGEREQAQARARRIERRASEEAHLLLAAYPSQVEANLSAKLERLTTALGRLLEGVSLIEEDSPSTRDNVLAFGERYSVAVLSTLLEATGVHALAVDAREWLTTSNAFGEAVVDWSRTQTQIARLEPVWRDVVSVHPGFVGQTSDHRTTTLGRNGSDYTATLLARGLEAEQITIWTDTSGVMTADPDLVEDAYPVRRLSYMEALELANFGARMLHTRTMIPLIESGIPLAIRNLQDPEDPGTYVDREGSRDRHRPTCVASLQGVAVLEVDAKRVADALAVGERVLKALAQTGVHVWMATQSGHGQSVSVVVDAQRIDQATRAIREELSQEILRGDVERVGSRSPVTLVTLVAEAMGKSVNVAGRMFGTLGTAGIGVWAIAQSGSSRSIACAVDARDTREAVNLVHAAFNLSEERVHVVVLGPGTVGKELLDQIRTQADQLAQETEIRLEVAGLSNSRRYIVDPAGIDLSAWPQRLEEGTLFEGGADPDALLARTEKLSVRILVDCTAATGMENVYRRAFARGFHVVAANKHPLTIGWTERQQLFREAQARYRYFHYETTVGASLPVIDTLRNLVRTGDRISRVEGSLSGTLGYLCNALMDGIPLSEAVRDAKQKGYTEPHPRDDLTGMDAARKALILARELGLALELPEVKVEPLVPAEMLAADDLDGFFACLERYDATMTKTVETQKAAGQVLRYLATVDPHTADRTAALRVGPTWIPADHPATRLEGTQAFLAFFTERYAEHPLVIQGAGAGGAVTAAGVLADVLKIAQSMRGR